MSSDDPTFTDTLTLIKSLRRDLDACATHIRAFGDFYRQATYTLHELEQRASRTVGIAVTTSTGVQYLIEDKKAIGSRWTSADSPEAALRMTREEANTILRRWRNIGYSQVGDPRIVNLEVVT